MADTFTKADVERLVADALKMQSAEHAKAVEELKRAASKTEAQKAQETAQAEHLAKVTALRAQAREVQGATAATLKYVVGPEGAYNNGAILSPGQIATKKNSDEPKDLPSATWSVYDKGAPKAAPAPEPKAALTAAAMNKLDAERPKQGVLAPKKGPRPSDTEV